MNPFDIIVYNEALDNYFGLPTLEVEDTVEQLHSEGLLTSYLDFYQIFQWLTDHGVTSMTDIGAGLGRSSLCADLWFSHLKILCLEKDKDRVNIAQLSGVEVINKDCCEFFVSPNSFQTQSYYLYFPWSKELYPFLKGLKSLKGSYVVVTESYGDFITLLRVHAPWLKKVDQLESFSSRQSQMIEFFQVEDHPSRLELSEQISMPEQLAAWLLSENNLRDFGISFESAHQSVKLPLSDIEIAFYPERGFTIERLRPRRLYWWNEISRATILPSSNL